MLIITPDEVLAYAFSPREKITPGSIRRAKIDVAQEHFIRPVVGQRMFECFTAGKFAPFVNEYIKPALAHYVRYGVIAEFLIRMGDDGAVLYQGGELDTGFSKETTGQDSSVRGQAVSEEQTVSKTSESESSGGETASVTVDSDENRRTSVAKTSTDSSSDEETTVTTDGDESRTTTVSKTSSGESSDRTVSEKSGQTDVTDNKSSSLSVSERSGRSNREFRPATDAQRNLIMRRSLADADVLLAKAVRYMVRHADLFPGFDPREVRPAGIITGFSTLDSGGLWK